MAHSLLFGERSLTTVAALFGQAQDARDAAEHVVRDARLSTEQVKVLGPGDPVMEKKLEPEEPGIVRTVIKAHIALGIVGLILGLLIAWLLIVAEVGFAVSSPYYVYVVLGVFGLLGGLMSGGLVSIRPDRTILDVKVEEAVHEGQWAVVVHPTDRGQEERALDVLEHSGGDVVQTL
jgi:hypothetical protein